GAEGRSRHLGMQMCWRANVDEIEIGIGTHLLESGIALDFAEIHARAGWSEIAADAAPIAGEFLRIARAHGRHPCAAQLRCCQVMDHAHETDADDSNSYHRRMPLVPGCSFLVAYFAF